MHALCGLCLAVMVSWGSCRVIITLCGPLQAVGSHLSCSLPGLDAQRGQARLQLRHVHFPIRVGVQLSEQILVHFGRVVGAPAVREEQLPRGLIHR